MRTTFIYALKDPNTDDIRYIGKADDPKKRLRDHVNRCEDEETHKNNWLKKLLTQGQRPKLVVLKKIPADAWKEWEIRYITCAKNLGFDLVNGSEGGEGFQPGEKNPMFGGGAKHPNYGNPLSEKTRQRIREANTGYRHSEAAKRKMGLAKKGNRPCFGIKHKNNTSGFVGVYWEEKRKKWRAQISITGVRKYLRRFNTLEDAVFTRALYLAIYEN